jgi:hypothetical protein
VRGRRDLGRTLSEEAPLSSIVRVVIYARGTLEEVDGQRRRNFTRAADAGIQVVGFAADTGDDLFGWVSACWMLADGKADKILVSCHSVVPSVAVDHLDGRGPGRRPKVIDQPE